MLLSARGDSSRLFSLGAILTITLFAQCIVCSAKTPVHVLGLYPMSGPWAGGEALYPAIQLAIQDVNAAPGILDDYDLRTVFADTKVGNVCNRSSTFRIHVHTE